MKITINGFIVARQYSWEQAPTFSWLPYDPTEKSLVDTVKVKPHEIVFDVSDDFDFSTFNFNALKHQRMTLQIEISEIVKKIEKIDFQLQMLSKGQT